MAELDILRMPTGISSLDPLIDGGVPAGSVILLLGEIGSGMYEFIYSSIMYLTILKQKTRMEGILIPDEIRYMTFTRLSDDVLREIQLSFDEEIVKFVDNVQFDDLSEMYFDASVVPAEWYSQEPVMERLRKRSEKGHILARLSDSLSEIQPGSLIILDSITDIATQYAGTQQWKDLIAFFRGLQRVSKEWNSTIYLPLTRGILDIRSELEIADTTDAVLLFNWEESAAGRRKREMYFQKFRGLMPHLEEKDLVKFAVRISSGIGFEVRNIRVVV
jgi:archaellum biogenesis ATPase FlaH